MLKNVSLLTLGNLLEDTKSVYAKSLYICLYCSQMSSVLEIIDKKFSESYPFIWC